MEIKTYTWKTDQTLYTNDEVMDDFINYEMEEIFPDSEYEIIFEDGNYIEVRNIKNGEVYEIIAMENGNLQNHKVEYKLIR